MSDRISEIKARCELATILAMALKGLDAIRGKSTLKSETAGVIEKMAADNSFLLDEIERLTIDKNRISSESIMHQETLAKQTGEIDRLTAERDAAVNDCKGYCSTCAFAGDCSKHDRNDSGDADWYYGDCEHWEWRGVEK